MTYMVLCETAHGKRYHVFTDVPESYNEDRVWQLEIEDPDAAVESGYVLPGRWDEEGDAEAAFGEAFDAYREQKERMEFEAQEEEDWRERQRQQDLVDALYSDDEF